MSTVCITVEPKLTDTRRAFVLAEHRVGHYPQFREFFVRAFELNRIGLARPGYVAGPSGAVYALVFIGRSGEPFPAGVEIYAIVPALEPLDETTVDRDLWALLRWMIEGTGGDWTVDDLEATGRLYKGPAVAP
jgi:hypothetical protein